MKPFFETESVTLYLGDCREILPRLVEKTGAFADLVFADPPYLLSNGGITCVAGRMVSVNKASWDHSNGVEADHQFHLDWLSACRLALVTDGAIWVSGTMHAIYSIGYAMQVLGYRLLADIVWFKVNPPPNLSCRTFTHSHETLLWAARDHKARHVFNYKEMKAEAGGKQMKSLWPVVYEQDLPEWVWALLPPGTWEKRYGKHPTQKPEAIVRRCIKASSRPGDTILDPFCGSGTTGVAALELGRRFVGIDTDERFLEVTRLRIEDALHKQSKTPTLSR